MELATRAHEIIVRKLYPPAGPLWFSDSPSVLRLRHVSSGGVGVEAYSMKKEEDDIRT